ncbi:MAG: AAA family ATPase [Synergistaceae bacterium]|nr:AAA family ATPase [Synergistaceae bacterium]
MKILSITFENLNSLRGKWRIDLTDKAYTSDGIFAITGSTGAGKTTIFDAICLALYGCTPRLGSVTSGSNEIMSRGKSSCYAHVTFTADKKNYTAKWGQSKKNGELQTPEHRLEDSDNGIPLTSKNNDTLREIIRLTGMDFKRFTRAMMLEQGKFDSFLTSSKNERAEILELITGTEIYSTISKEVYTRAKKEKDILREKGIELEAFKSSGGTMTSDEIQAEIEHRKAALAALEAGFKSAREARDWLREIRTIDQNISNNDADIETQTKRFDAFEPGRIILERAERAASIETDYTKLKSAREILAKCAESVRVIQEGIAQREAAIAEISDMLPKLLAELEGKKHGITDSPDAVALKVETAVGDYVKAVHDKIESERKTREAEGKVNALQRELKDIVEAGKKARAKMEEAGQKQDQALREFMALRARTTAAVLDEERSKLQPGSPCPLCGSREHPAFTHEHTSGESSQELFTQMDSFSEKLEALKKAYDAAQNEHSELSDRWSNYSAALSAEMNRVMMSKEDVQAKTEKLSACHSAVSEAIRPLCFGEVNGTEKVLSMTREWAERVSQLEKDIQKSQAEKGNLESVLATEKASLERVVNDLKEAEAVLAEQEAAFKLCLAEKNFADEGDFVLSLQNIRQLPDLRREWQELNNRMNALQGIKENLARKLADKKALNLTQKGLEEAEADFAEHEAAVIAAKGDIASLEQKFAEINSQQARIDELTGKYDEQKLTSQKWSALSEMIGSSKGDAYRVFAQQITLVLVVNNANTYLERMSGRYTLILTPDSDDLSISVIDGDQAGEIRPTTNLSGGERFIVSLALALGLSQISGSKARVDSLFLDEGFGALDEDSLNTALEALAEIRREGRMIGIISHVAALKERIATQINVIPKQEGVSIIEGAGCSKL